MPPNTAIGNSLTAAILTAWSLIGSPEGFSDIYKIFGIFMSCIAYALLVTAITLHKKSLEIKAAIILIFAYYSLGLSALTGMTKFDQIRNIEPELSCPYLDYSSNFDDCILGV